MMNRVEIGAGSVRDAMGREIEIFVNHARVDRRESQRTVGEKRKDGLSIAVART